MTAGSRDVDPNVCSRYGIRGTFRFALAGALGFGVPEIVLWVGLLIVYGSVGIPRESFSSPDLIALDAASLTVGTSASFFINESHRTYRACSLSRRGEEVGPIPEVPSGERIWKCGHRPGAASAARHTLGHPARGNGRGGDRHVPHGVHDFNLVRVGRVDNLRCAERSRRRTLLDPEDPCG